MAGAQTRSETPRLVERPKKPSEQPVHLRLDVAEATEGIPEIKG